MISERAFKLKKNGEPYKGCFCRHPELIENYDKAVADKTQKWEVHHRLESCFTQKFLKEMSLYFDVEPEALIFLTRTEHRKMDSMHKRQGEAQKGRKPLWRMKKVLCVETGEIFDSTREASRKTGICNIDKVCRGEYKAAGGFHWKFYN